MPDPQPPEGLRLHEARATLLRALERLEEAHDELGDPAHLWLVVGFIYDGRSSYVRCWEATDQPPFITRAVLAELSGMMTSSDEEVEDED